MNIAIGADHRGFLLKEYVRLTMTDFIWLDVGAYTNERSDYPFFAQQVCMAICSGKVDSGVLLCATGIGMAIAANRYPNIYAALAWNSEIAMLSRRHEASNVLVLPSDYISPEDTIDMIKAWHSTKPLNSQYQKRLRMIDKLP
jgi:ribose 5-phosphate isomerase B